MVSICPRCDSRFNAEAWTDGACPSCGEPFTWHCACEVDDTADECWPLIAFEYQRTITGRREPEPARTVGVAH